MEIFCDYVNHPKSEPSSILIGGFYPWGRHHKRILDLFKNSCKFHPLVCLLNPSPFGMLHHMKTHQVAPHMEDPTQLACRITKRTGVNVALCKLGLDDLELSAGMFFDQLEQMFLIREIFLKKNQTIGRGPQGSFEGVFQRFKAFGGEVKILPDVSIEFTRLEIMATLRNGNIADFNRMTGYFPTISRQTGSSLGWGDGKYIAKFSRNNDIIQFSVDKGIVDLKFADFKELDRILVIKGPGDK